MVLNAVGLHCVRSLIATDPNSLPTSDCGIPFASVCPQLFRVVESVRSLGELEDVSLVDDADEFRDRYPLGQPLIGRRGSCAGRVVVASPRTYRLESSRSMRPRSRSRCFGVFTGKREKSFVSLMSAKTPRGSS